MRTIRILLGVALLSTGLLAGAFGYGVANLVPAFDSVPIGMRLDFHAQLMKTNGITMQTAMAVSAVSAFALAAVARARVRALAATAGLLTVASFLITRFGNVPINGRIKQWAVTAPPADHAEILRRWELFNDARTCTAVVAFAVLIGIALRQAGGPSAGRRDGSGGGAGDVTLAAVALLPEPVDLGGVLARLVAHGERSCQGFANSA
ncbi:DUF1772 domain-containing protein [Streptomyces sp. NPDC051079]|uniref:DUF1772 domain-containing protein n=1 Tax=Streptomyces sp. NPDC051079 TaxID=3155043 RepID=UPI00344D28EC